MDEEAGEELGIMLELETPPPLPLPVPIESKVGCKFLAALMGEPSISRLRRKFETTAVPVEPAPEVTFIEVCKGITI